MLSVEQRSERVHGRSMPAVRYRFSVLRLSACSLICLTIAAPLVAQPNTQRFGGPRRETSNSTSPPQVTQPATPPQNTREPVQSFDQQLAQTARPSPRDLKTFVEFTVLTPMFGGSLEAQRWAKQLTELGVECRFRGATGADEVGVEELVRGPLRTVRVIGELTADGRLRVAEKAYRLDDARLLKEWIDGLKTYGAQGSPQGQPLWGLTEPQFTTVYEGLSQVVEVELEGLPVADAIAKLPLPAAHPLRNTAAADAWTAEHPGASVDNRVQGLSCGTALALILSEAGLGVRPTRTPNGGMELHVEPLSAGGQVWPIGWELAEDVDHGQLAPILHKFAEIGFDDAALQDVLDATAAAIEVPILVDYHRIRATGVDLAEKSVSYPLKRTTWGLMLNSVIRKANLIKEVRTDELGKPFVFITPFVPTPVERAR